MDLEYQNEELGKKCREIAHGMGITIIRRSEWDIDVYYTTNSGKREKRTLARWEYVYDFLSEW